MKRIVLLNGCYERMETPPLAAAKAFLKGFNKDNDYEVVTINLYDKNIEYCTGCKECIANKHKCCICDDFKHILDKTEGASYIVWVAPIYALSLPSKIKALLERILAFHIEDEEGKMEKTSFRYIVFSTCGLYSHDNKFKELNKYLDVFFGKNSFRLICPSEEDEYLFEDKETDSDFIKNFKEIGWEYRSTGKVTLESKKKLYGSFMAKDLLYNLFGAITEEGSNNAPNYIKDIIRRNHVVKDTNILLFFLPWIAMCLFMPLSSKVAGVVAIVLCSFTPILGIKYSPTIYDRISISSATIISLFLIFLEKGIYLSCIAYFIIGALCIVSLLTDIPISAYYFYKYYFNIESFGKDRFIRINRIISASWGGILILFSLIDKLFITSSFSKYIGITVIIIFQLSYIIAVYIPRAAHKYRDNV